MSHFLLVKCLRPSQVEVKAVPVSQKKSLQPDNVKKLQRLPGSCSPSSSGPDLTFGGLPAPKLEATYEPMIVKEARYIAITMMKVSLIGLGIMFSRLQTAWLCSDRFLTVVALADVTSDL